MTTAQCFTLESAWCWCLQGNTCGWTLRMAASLIFPNDCITPQDGPEPPPTSPTIGMGASAVFPGASGMMARALEEEDLAASAKKRQRGSGGGGGARSIQAEASLPARPTVIRIARPVSYDEAMKEF